MAAETGSIQVNDAIEDAEQIAVSIKTEPYEGDVAVHIFRDKKPDLSLYLSPIDAAILAERVLAAAREMTHA
jgi:hypothetical protein